MSRSSTLPPVLFHGVLTDLLPLMAQRHAERERPLPPAVVWAQQHFTALVALDGSTLDVLLRKVDLLQGAEKPVLAGRMAALLNVVTHLPQQVWYEEDSAAHDQRFWERVLSSLTSGLLLLFDLGFLNYARDDQLTEQQAPFITRAAKTLALRVERVLQATSVLHDQIVWVGSSKEGCCAHPLRLVAVLHQGTW